MIDIASYRRFARERRIGPAQRHLALDLARADAVCRMPEYRALAQIVADAQAAGVPVIALDPYGTFEIAAGAAGEVTA